MKKYFVSILLLFTSFFTFSQSATVVEGPVIDVSYKSLGSVKGAGNYWR